MEQDSSRAEVRKATRLAMANRDLLEADSYLHALEKLPAGWSHSDDEASARRGLLCSAIIHYAKSFGANWSSDIADKNIHIGDYENVDIALHEKLLNLRNRAIAHSDPDVIPAQIIDHEHENLLIVVTRKFDVLEEIAPTEVRAQISTLLDQIQRQLHEYSDLLRTIPGALGSKIEITIHDYPEPKDG